MYTIKNSCLPKLICELNASPDKEKLTDSEKALLSLIRYVTNEEISPSNLVEAVELDYYVMAQTCVKEGK
jgi:hypothetical protein